MVALLAAPAAEIEIRPAEVLARLKAAVAAKDIDATGAACNEAARISGEPYQGGPMYPTQNGPAGLTRREKLEFRLGVLDRLVTGIDQDELRHEAFALNVWAPGVPSAGMDPRDVKNPLVRKEYERRIAENKRKADNNRRNNLLEHLKTNWIRSTEYIVARYYRNDPADMAEFNSALSAVVHDEALRSQLETRFEAAAKPATR